MEDFIIYDTETLEKRGKIRLTREEYSNFSDFLGHAPNLAISTFEDYNQAVRENEVCITN
jgi:hypothetical protein